MKPTVLIVGGGLAGLAAAHHLHQAGIDFRLLEARARLGGRILTCDADGAASSDGFDLGPSWFWPDIQPALGALVRELGLAAFAQHDEGDMLFERVRGEAPRRLQGMRQEPASMRIAGGSGALVSALAAGLPQSSIRLGARVTRVALAGSKVELEFVDANGSTESLGASYVLFTLPPRLLATSIAFSPGLDAATVRNWRDTPTWMAPHAKFFALYDRPFWREAGLSGTAQSTVGPLVEIHDATSAPGKAALFGFVGVPAAQRTQHGQAVVVEAAIRQLARLFGPEAGSPRATLFKDWAVDSLTATAEDAQAGGHPESGRVMQAPGEWQGRIWLAGSEAALQDAGYLSGAVHAAEYAVAKLVNQRESDR
ncbi:MAG TPA: FAD-dependent oxidoreductase [Aggregatilineales bacterium]|mgnify:CR=1 FL=1|nr:FAD-dependent oxidoreductase [Aggregatilineales bacterium]